MVIFGDYDLAGVDARTGTRLWLLDSLSGARVAAGAVPFQVDSGTVYAGSYLGSAFALDAVTGAVKWRSDLIPGAGNQVRVHAVSDGHVFLTVRYNGPFYSATAYALDATTGTVLWSYDMGRSSIARDVVLASTGPSTSLLILDLEGGRIVALTSMTGAQAWEIPAPPGPASLRQLAAAGGSLVASASSYPGFIAGYDLQTGSQKWSVPSRNGAVSPYYNMIWTDGVVAYACFSNGVLGAYDVATGAELWFRRPPSGGFTGAPSVGRDTLFVAGWNGAYAIEK